VRLSPLGTSATVWLIIPTPYDRWWWLWSSRWNENWQEKPKYSEKTFPSATLSTINPTWPDLGSNPDRRFGKLATNLMSDFTAYGNIHETQQYTQHWMSESWKKKLKVCLQNCKRYTQPKITARGNYDTNTCCTFNRAKLSNLCIYLSLLLPLGAQGTRGTLCFPSVSKS
jgi:hypothetical protein